MGLKTDLADNYIARLSSFDLEEDSVQVLESARRFVRSHSSVATQDDLRVKINEIHRLLEGIIQQSIERTDIKAAFVDLARRYTEENRTVAETSMPEVPVIGKDRLRLISGLTYEDNELFHASRSETPRSDDSGAAASAAGDPGSHREGQRKEDQEGDGGEEHYRAV